MSVPAFREGVCLGCGGRLPLALLRAEDAMLDNGTLPKGYCDACARGIAAMLIAREERRHVGDA